MTRRRSADWRVERSGGSAARLLDPWPLHTDVQLRALRTGRVEGRAALVLGSTQDAAAIDAGGAARAGVEVVRRTTGGGAVLIAPDAQVWLDVWVPRGDELWDDDVINAATWLGDAWVDALEGLGARSLVVHRGRSTKAPLGDLVCFAGLGPGEVQVESAHSHRAKVVGLAQRRTRLGARFHATAPVDWEPERLLDVLRCDDVEDVRARLESVAVGLRAVLAPGSDRSDLELIRTVEDAVIGVLP